MTDSQNIMNLIQDIQMLLDKGLKNYYSNNQLTVPQLTVVTLLGKHEKLKITDISKELKISPAAVSGIIDRLENQGLVERHRCEVDKRKVYVSLSDSFKSTHKHLEQNISGFLHLLLREQDQDVVGSIVKSLSTLKGILEDGEDLLSKHIERNSKR